MRGVSVVIPVYNGEATIKHTIGSALGQQIDRPVDLVVVNDGSTDSTATILESYGFGITLVTQPNRGVAAARNAGVNVSNGEYLAFLDADDLWLQGHLEKTCAALDANPDAVLAFTDMIWIEAGETGARVVKAGHAPTMDDLFHGANIAPSTLVMRRAAFEQCGGFQEEFRLAVGYEDTYLCLVARERGAFVYVPEPTVVYRGAPATVYARKYSLNFPVFMRLVRSRYGQAAETLIERKTSDVAASLFQGALQRMDSGDISGAVKSWLALFRLKPSCLANRDVALRLFRLRNWIRLARALRRPAARTKWAVLV